MPPSEVQIKTVACKPFDDQRPGTARLRKKVSVFQQDHYLESFIQAVFDTVNLASGATLVIGGDGRYFNDEAIRVIASMAAAQNVGQLLIGQDGLLSTPAASNLIRKRHAQNLPGAAARLDEFGLTDPVARI